jgi:hypothetical protein
MYVFYGDSIVYREEKGARSMTLFSSIQNFSHTLVPGGVSNDKAVDSISIAE